MPAASKEQERRPDRTRLVMTKMQKALQLFCRRRKKIAGGE